MGMHLQVSQVSPTHSHLWERWMRLPSGAPVLRCRTCGSERDWGEGSDD